MSDLWRFIEDFFINLSLLWNWLSTPISELGGFKPLELIGVAGITFLAAFWIIHLIRFW